VSAASAGVKALGLDLPTSLLTTADNLGVAGGSPRWGALHSATTAGAARPYDGYSSDAHIATRLTPGDPSPSDQSIKG
jgi:hypothetical protein